MTAMFSCSSVQRIFYVGGRRLLVSILVVWIVLVLGLGALEFRKSSERDALRRESEDQSLLQVCNLVVRSLAQKMPVQEIL